MLSALLLDLKNVAIAALGSFLGAAGLVWLTVGTKGFTTLRRRFARPEVEIVSRRTPKNIFTAIELGAPREWLKEQLGPPNRIGKNWWGYRFSDSLVSISFDTDDALETLAVALVDDESTFEFPTVHFDCPPLGEMHLSDVMQEHLNLEYNESMRHSELIVSGREGPKGAWHYIAFGVLSPHIPGPALEGNFSWDKEKGQLTSPPSWSKITWAAKSTRSEIWTFPWDFGLNLA